MRRSTDHALSRQHSYLVYVGNTMALDGRDMHHNYHDIPGVRWEHRGS